MINLVSRGGEELLYYRFRPYSELAIKEFMYDEIYFSSAIECNDPFDGKVFLSFEADKEKWRRLLECAWKGFDAANKLAWEEQLSEYLASISPITYGTALGLNYNEILRSLSFPPKPLVAMFLDAQIKRFLNLYKPRNKYFVSLSRSCNNILMWSHYASMHRGHCLIFKAVDGCLYQCPRRKKNAIRRNTPAGIGQSMSFSLPDRFPFQEVIYSPDTTHNNAFYYFPSYVVGRELEEQEKLELDKKQSEQYLLKHNCWSYEQESRLILDSPDSWLFGENVELTQQERLFYYLPNQLVGVILGARMDAQQKMRFRELIQARMERIAHDPGDNTPVFYFTLFEATLHDNSREVVIEPKEIFTLTETIKQYESNFEKYLHEWREGWALVFNKSSGYREQFL
ncbi:DUF2971 domain-containing protein [Brevibacillus sp. MCWH]|jgi:hypothetical protein|nr:DUF2971 domain-containing protein [Brevibacillus sp. MCWH]